MARARRNATPSLLDPPELRTGPVATVALFKPLDKPYSYRVPIELADRLYPGMRVMVPIGRDQRTELGICLSVSDETWTSTLKPVLSILDESPVLSESMMGLGQWIARYYCSHLGRTLDLMVPAAAKKLAGWKSVRYVTLVNVTDSTAALPGESSRRSGVTARQVAVITTLETAGTRVESLELCRQAGCTPATLTTLAKKGYIRFDVVQEPVLPDLPEVERFEPNYELNSEQKAAITEIATVIASRRFTVDVLYGVTGSGKTEVYVAAIRQALADGRQAILLVPEIALSTQTVRRLQARFDRVAVIHSALTGVQRSRTWAAVSSGAIPVVIGTRSAVFAPCPNLGVIIVDEESEPSYKSQSAPRYHTRDVAIRRAQLEGIPVILGSAAPSLETWRNVQTRKHYRLLRLRQRVRDLPMPTVHLVDMHDEHKARRGVHLLSRLMEEFVGQTIQRGEQAVLLLNRRGYASFLHCPRCDTVVQCPHCSVRMVFHATTELAHCHYCHTRMPIPNRCQSSGCGGTLVRFGIGTQRVEEELHTKFPSARIRRMDSDTMDKPGDYADILGGFERREFDLLVGTQMIAKGLDFPFVSFVGVISADTALALEDFRSEERTFQLVLQVAGRSGRGDIPGHVVVQTFAADTAAIQHAVSQKYEAFAERELGNRRQHKLPPYSRLMRIILSDPRMTRLKSACADLATRIRDLLGRQGIRYSTNGPQPCPIARIRDMYRFDLQLTFPTADLMLKAIDLFKSEGTLKSQARSLVVDVDPLSLQ